MTRTEFVAGLQVRPVGSNLRMTLEGSIDDWMCAWMHDGQMLRKRYMPEELERIKDESSAGTVGALANRVRR